MTWEACVSRMADASSPSASGARRHSSAGAARNEPSPFRYSVSVMRTLGLESAMSRECTIDGASTRFLFFEPHAPFGHGDLLTAAPGQTRVRYKVLTMTMALGA